MLEILVSVDFWKFVLPLLGAIVAWFANESRKRVWEQYQRKEASYKELVRSLQGFYVGSPNSMQFKSEFINQLNQCWLYCPDEVIRKGYAFLESVHQMEKHSDAEKEKALGDFVAAIRLDLLSRHLVKQTRLTGDDFRHFKVTPL